jgi:putative nucleotidyltransferase with HDIG domain
MPLVESSNGCPPTRSFKADDGSVRAGLARWCEGPREASERGAQRRLDRRIQIHIRSRGHPRFPWPKGPPQGGPFPFGGRLAPRSGAQDSGPAKRKTVVVNELSRGLVELRSLELVPGAIERVVEVARQIDVRDGGTAKHSQVVARYAELTARELELPDDVVEDIRLAGLLHDVGKSVISERILAKPAPLTDLEWLEMRRHPWIAVELLEGSGLEEITEWIYCHHERPDGAGYPRGLSGDEIPLEARILAVADAYEAMTNDRIYRRAIGRWRACEELWDCAGAQFDEVVVGAFLRVVEREEAGEL